MHLLKVCYKICKIICLALNFETWFWSEMEVWTSEIVKYCFFLFLQQRNQDFWVCCEKKIFVFWTVFVFNECFVAISIWLIEITSMSGAEKYFFFFLKSFKWHGTSEDGCFFLWLIRKFLHIYLRFRDMGIGMSIWQDLKLIVVSKDSPDTFCKTLGVKCYILANFQLRQWQSANLKFLVQIQLEKFASFPLTEGGKKPNKQQQKKVCVLLLGERCCHLQSGCFLHIGTWLTFGSFFI